MFVCAHTSEQTHVNPVCAPLFTPPPPHIWVELTASLIMPINWTWAFADKSLLETNQSKTYTDHPEWEWDIGGLECFCRACICLTVSFLYPSVHHLNVLQISVMWLCWWGDVDINNEDIFRTLLWHLTFITARWWTGSSLTNNISKCWKRRNAKGSRQWCSVWLCEYVTDRENERRRKKEREEEINKWIKAV